MEHSALAGQQPGTKTAKRGHQARPWTETERRIIADGRLSDPPMEWEKIARYTNRLRQACKEEWRNMCASGAYGGENKSPTQRIKCLCCQEIFESKGVFNRICTPCKRSGLF